MLFTKLFYFIDKYWLPLTLILLVFIGFLSLWPLPQLPDVPGSDKTHHLIAYAALAFPTALRKPKKWIFILALFILYSGMIELIQPYVNRYGEWLDMLANTAGVLSGTLIAYLIKFYQK